MEKVFNIKRFIATLFMYLFTFSMMLKSHTNNRSHIFIIFGITNCCFLQLNPTHYLLEKIEHNFNNMFLLHFLLAFKYIHTYLITIKVKTTDMYSDNLIINVNKIDVDEVPP